jgi:hypothetical protein
MHCTFLSSSVKNSSTRYMRPICACVAILGATWGLRRTAGQRSTVNDDTGVKACSVAIFRVVLACSAPSVVCLRAVRNWKSSPGWVRECAGGVQPSPAQRAHPKPQTYTLNPKP